MYYFSISLGYVELSLSSMWKGNLIRISIHFSEEEWPRMISNTMKGQVHIKHWLYFLLEALPMKRLKKLLCFQSKPTLLGHRPNSSKLQVRLLEIWELRASSIKTKSSLKIWILFWEVQLFTIQKVFLKKSKIYIMRKVIFRVLKYNELSYNKFINI
jgi:hypothetical protein